MSPPTGFTNTIFCCSCSGAFAARYGCFQTTSMPRACAGFKTLREFDDRVTAYYCGFTGADDYYARAAAANVIDRIALPALVIHAANDPFIRILPQTRQALLSNPNITYIETEDGGHCAFVGEHDGNSTGISNYDGRWAEREVVEFARQFQRSPACIFANVLADTSLYCAVAGRRNQARTSAPRPFIRVRMKARRSIARKIVSSPKDADSYALAVLGQNRKTSIDEFDVHPVDQQRSLA